MAPGDLRGAAEAQAAVYFFAIVDLDAPSFKGATEIPTGSQRGYKYLGPNAQRLLGEYALRPLLSTGTAWS